MAGMSTASKLLRIAVVAVLAAAALVSAPAAISAVNASQFNQCGSVSLGVSSVSGTTETFTANATACWNPNPLYAFYIRPYGATAWTSVQAYSTNNVLVWDTSHQPSSYVSVWAKDALSSTATFDQTAVSGFTTSTQTCTGVTLSAAPESPQNQGTLVTLTASATGCANPQFLFWIREAWNPNWQALSPGQPVPGFPDIPSYPVYATSNTFSWDTTGNGLGPFYLGVWAKDASSSASYDAYTSIPFTLGFCSATISAAPASPQLSGTQVTFTAAASGCSNGGGTFYEFWMRPASQTTWQLVQAYSESNQFHWNSTGAQAGIVYFGVWAKDNAGSPEPYDAFASTPFQVTAPACTGVTISAAPTSVVHGSGTHSVITANASGCPDANPLYEFVMRPASQTIWQVVQNYSTSNSFDWNSTGAAPGTVYFGVWVKDANSPNQYDAVQSTSVTVT